MIERISCFRKLREREREREREGETELCRVFLIKMGPFLLTVFIDCGMSLSRIFIPSQ